MRTSTKIVLLTSVLLLSKLSIAQQEKESPGGFYRLEFVARELDDNKVITTRTYIATASEKATSQIRTGGRVPVTTKSKDTSGNTVESVTYLDLGVNIDARDIREVAGQLSLVVNADISSAATGDGAPLSGAPVIHQYRWNSGVIVPLRKATQIFSSDDLNSKRKFQIELTATPIK